MSTGSKIRAYRKLKGLTQKQLGEMTDTLEAGIRKYELGTRNPKPDQLLKLASALGISPIMLYDTDSERYKINTIADALGYVFLLQEQLDVTLKADEDESGNPIPNTAILKFNDPILASKLYDWLRTDTIMKEANQKLRSDLPKELAAVQNADFEKIEFIISECRKSIIDKDTLALTPKRPIK